MKKISILWRLLIILNYSHRLAVARGLHVRCVWAGGQRGNPGSAISMNWVIWADMFVCLQLHTCAQHEAHKGPKIKLDLDFYNCKVPTETEKNIHSRWLWAQLRLHTLRLFIRVSCQVASVPEEHPLSLSLMSFFEFDLLLLQVLQHLWLLGSAFCMLSYLSLQHKHQSLHLEAIAVQSHYQITRLKTHRCKPVCELADVVRWRFRSCQCYSPPLRQADRLGNLNSWKWEKPKRTHTHTHMLLKIKNDLVQSFWKYFVSLGALVVTAANFPVKGLIKDYSIL